MKFPRSLFRILLKYDLVFSYVSRKSSWSFFLRGIFWVVLGLVHSPVSVAQVDETGNYSLRMDIEGHTMRIPYFADRDMGQTDPAVNKVVIVVHGANRNAGDYYRNMKAAESMSAGFTDSVMVIAPQFLEEEDLDPNHLDASYLYWSGGWKSGSRSKDNDGHPRPVRISSYAVLDTLMMRVVSAYPELKYIIFTGHSAGGQLTNRYSASSPVADILFRSYGIYTRFIVANPGSYLYLDNKRVVKGSTDRFEVPSTYCSGYNEWRYGLEDLYAYPDQFGADSIRRMLERREVVYLLGELDTSTTSSSLDQSCKAELQGRNRLERGSIYYNYLIAYYGVSISRMQHRDTVPNTGHDNYYMYTSATGRYWLFENDPGQAPLAVDRPVAEKMRIWPNPAVDHINIRPEGDSRQTTCSLYTVGGKVLIRDRPLLSVPFMLDLEGFSPGAYLLIIRNERGSVRKMFIKK